MKTVKIPITIESFEAGEQFIVGNSFYRYNKAGYIEQMIIASSPEYQCHYDFSHDMNCETRTDERKNPFYRVYTYHLNVCTEFKLSFSKPVKH